ncbi:MAG: hypothetical protein QOG71_2255 [Pyrinomonadaceae bacterium]|nr:hypothetical protein [Pyrinomonadaceae bacterium]
MKVQEIIHRLQKVKKSGQGWTARCPAHDDQKNSLSISEGENVVLLYCHAGCSFEQVRAALGVIEETTKGNGQPQIKQTYDYRDEHGLLLHQNVRHEPKGFHQRRPDGNGGWINNLQGVRRVPYRFPELLKARSERLECEIVLLEGEKDADNAAQHGLVATNLKNWRSEFTQYLRGAKIVIIQDHDESGSKQALQTAQLLYGNVASLKLIDLFPDEPLPAKHGKDFSDWLERGGTVQQLEALVNAAPEWSPQSLSPTNTTIEPSKLFKLKSANTWLSDAAGRPTPKMLFSEFWFENELCILFSDTNLGKSILAVQIADSISRGQPVSSLTLEAEAQKVIYFDFELSDKQFERRYSIDGSKHFIFDDRFIRAEINPDAELPESISFETYLSLALEEVIVEESAKVVIVDNLTYLRTETEKAKDALPLMKQLKRLKSKYDLSVLALAHTPKRDMTRPLTLNDLAGSKHLSNFADSVFAIGQSSHDHSLRYLKQLKVRATEVVFHSDNVIICEIAKPSNFLGFSFVKYGNEGEHLQPLSPSEARELDAQIVALKESNPALSLRDIATSLGTNHTRVKRVLERNGGTGGTPVPLVPNVPTSKDDWGEIA